MNITLYEGVELRSDYSIVFDTSTSFWGTNTPFKKYLDTKRFYSEEIENTYFANDGSITISWPVYRKLPKGITYMRIFTEQDEIKYFFVNSYEYRNELLVLNYTLDVWHTYSNDMKIHSGIIDRALHYKGRRTLPINYQTNKGLVFNGEEDEFYLVAEYQVYRLTVEAQEAIDRFSYTSLVGHREFTVSGPDETSYEPSKTIHPGTDFTYTVEEAIQAINELTAHQGVLPVQGYDLGSPNSWAGGGISTSEREQKVLDYDMGIYTVEFPDTFPDKVNRDIRYELLSVYAIPKSIFAPDTFDFDYGYNKPLRNTITILDTVDVEKDETGTEKEHFNFLEYSFTYIKNEVAYKKFTIPANQKTVGVGLTSLYIPVGFTGQDQEITFCTQANAFGLDISVLGPDGLSSLTSYFAVPIPFLTPSGTERQIAAINRQSAKINAVAGTVALAFTIGSSFSGLAGGLAKAAAQGAELASVSGGISKTTVATFQRQASREILGLQAKEGFSSLTKQGAGLTYQTGSLINSFNTLGKPMSSGNATESGSIALINAALGFSTYTIIPSNEEEVDYIIDRIGYNTWIEQNDYHTSRFTTALEGKYEPISFATLSINGPFPNDMAASLENILTNGAIISYDPEIFTIL